MGKNKGKTAKIPNTTRDILNELEKVIGSGKFKPADPIADITPQQAVIALGEFYDCPTSCDSSYRFRG